MPYFDNNGARIHFEVKGNTEALKPPVLLLHGNGESMEIFDPCIKPLLKRYCFIAMDSRGQGLSTLLPGAPQLSYGLMAYDAYALIKYLGVYQCDCMGASDGAIMALMLAMAEYSRSLIRRIIAIGANISPDGLKPKAHAAIKAERARAKDAFEYDRLDLMLREPNIPLEKLSGISAQTAIVVGSRDIIKRSHTESIANAIMRARLVTINGADHFIPQNNPDRLREILLEEFE